jgi:heptosyltransferase-1
VTILLIRLRLIGDVVFTTPAVRAIRHAFPGARLTYLVERASAPIVLGSPHLDEVLVIDRPRGIARIAHDLRLARRLRAGRFDVVVDFHGGPRAAWLVWASGAPRRIGYEMAGRRWMYTDVVARPRELRARHSVENQWDLLAALDAALSRSPDRARDPVEMVEDPDAARNIDRRLAAAGIGPGHAVIVVHVSAGNAFRRWPVESFVDLVAALSTTATNRRIILSSGPSDAEAASRVREAAWARLGPAGSRIVDVGDTSLGDLRSLVARAALFIGGDTGPLHVASTTATPIVAIFGPTLPERSAPWRDPALVSEAADAGSLPCRPCDQRRCVPGDFRCLTGVRAAQVVEAAERALARAAGLRTSDSTA